MTELLLTVKMTYPITRKILQALLLCFFLFQSNCYSQDEPDTVYIDPDLVFDEPEGQRRWMRYLCKVNFDNGWYLKGDFGYRTELTSLYFDRLVLRSSVGKSLNSKYQVGAGVGLFNFTKSFFKQTREFRFYQELHVKNRWNGRKIQQRFRLEERFLENSNDEILNDTIYLVSYNNELFFRGRYRVKTDFKVDFLRKFFRTESTKLFVRSEFMLSAGKRKRNIVLFPTSRFTAGFDFKYFDELTFRLGYTYQIRNYFGPKIKQTGVLLFGVRQTFNTGALHASNRSRDK